jgi:hypothetical protein
VLYIETNFYLFPNNTGMNKSINRLKKPLLYNEAEIQTNFHYKLIEYVTGDSLYIEYTNNIHELYKNKSDPCIIIAWHSDFEKLIQLGQNYQLGCKIPFRFSADMCCLKKRNAFRKYVFSLIQKQFMDYELHHELVDTLVVSKTNTKLETTEITFADLMRIQNEYENNCCDKCGHVLCICKN